jgi:hypothetical protein
LLEPVSQCRRDESNRCAVLLDDGSSASCSGNAPRTILSQRVTAFRFTRAARSCLLESSRCVGAAAPFDSAPRRARRAPADFAHARSAELGSRPADEDHWAGDAIIQIPAQRPRRARP